MILGHGNNRYYYKDKIKHDFSSNIAFNNHSKLIAQYLCSRMIDIENYPDPTANILSHKIAKHHCCDARSIVVCNGSAEAFYMIAHLISRQTKRARSLIFTPSFAEYEDSCKLYDHQIEYAELKEFTAIDYSLFNSVWIGSPNNPDGYRVSNRDIRSVAIANPNCLFIVDRAYNDLSTNCEQEESIHIKNAILVHSLTKSFGIPGVRLGYIIAHPDINEHLKELRPPWSVNALSLAAGEYIMDNYRVLNIDLDELLQQSLFLQQSLSKISYLEVTPSDSNFFLCRIVDGRTADELHTYLIEEHGILIRDASNFRGLTPYHFRVAAQCEEVNKILIESLQQWI
ncbi:MAG: aminotransferase class I/II-fold pyridoxal phosphate-dependent enzyme [Rikenellaceae bacterium]